MSKISRRRVLQSASAVTAAALPGAGKAAGASVPRVILPCAKDTYWVTFTDGRPRYTDPNMQKVTGLPAAEAVQAFETNEKSDLGHVGLRDPGIGIWRIARVQMGAATVHVALRAA